MGCDIHVHTEVKIDGVWHHYSTPSPRRNYDLFALMAGVRGREGITPIASPRGVPEDATALTKWDASLWGEDGHSHSWLSAHEIARVAAYAEAAGWKDQRGDSWWESGEFGWLLGNNWSGFVKYPDERPEGLEDIRWVFWFDN